MAVQVSCPHCKSVFSFQNSAPLGKRLPCPRCSEHFIAKPIGSGKTSDAFAKSPPGSRRRVSRVSHPSPGNNTPPRQPSGQPNRPLPASKSRGVNWQRRAIVSGVAVLLVGGIIAAVKVWPRGDSKLTDDALVTASPSHSGNTVNPANSSSSANSESNVSQAR